ncbi:MAG: hypothetical protein IKN27_13770, partial [Selenomonadaceae bacterium]|nr:hypothetical protein [Selenomonadaceae bacterium]
PAVTVQIDSIPLNQNGKVNKKMLPKPELNRTEKKSAQRTPNILEEELLEIVGEIIGTTEIDFTTKLTRLGLTSISAIKLSTQLYKKFGVNVHVKEFFTATIETIENKLLQAFLSGQRNEQKISSVAESSKITGVQRGIYLECMKDPLSTVYNMPLIYNFDADINTQKISDAIRKIFAAHPSVNVHFELCEDEILLVRNKNSEIEIPIHELDENGFANFKENFVKPFKLDSEPLYRLAIVKTPARVSLFTDFHHLIFDGTSMNLFMSNLKTVLEGGELKPEGARYFELVQEEEKVFDENRKFFAEFLKDFETASEIPSDVRGNVDGEIKIFEQKISNGVGDFCRENRLTPAALCLAVLSYVVARYTANRKVYLTTISSGRANVKFSDTFGMFVNTLPLVAELENISVAEFLKKVPAMFNAVIEHENYPFSQISADYSFTPKISYGYQVGVMEELNLEIPQFKGVEKFLNAHSKFKLTFLIVGERSAPRLSIEYNTADYSDTLIAGLAKSFNIVMEKFIADKNSPLLKISLIDDEREKILSTFR